MAMYVYPAVFTIEEDGRYSINFPDLESCYTCGDDLADGICMAEDVLALTLYHYEKDGREIPEPSKADELEIDDNEFVNFIVADTIGYQKKFNKKAVKKTLTIPEWLNELAQAANVNFSQVLQDALIERIKA